MNLDSRQSSRLLGRSAIRKRSRDGGGRRLAPLILATLVLGVHVLLALTQEEMERYGYGRDISSAAHEGTVKALPAPIARRPLPPGPVLPRYEKLPATAIPAPTRPAATIRLTPRAPGAAVRAPLSSRPGPPPPPDPIVEKLFPRQIRASYAGDGACIECHTEKGADQPHTLYGLIKSNTGVPEPRRGCEGCHGPGSEHVASLAPIVNPAKQTHLEISRLCLSCHEDQRRVRRLEWHITGHQEAFVACTTCHSVHHQKARPALAKEPDRLCIDCHKDQLARFRLRSRHPVKTEGSDALSSQREGKVRCIDCHQPYSTRNGADLLRREGKELCTKCHAETRGPFLFEHDSASGDVTHQCTACHMPHGSPNRDLLVVQGRGLCLRCHTDRVSHRPGPSCFNASCHRDIHGSNLNQLFLPR